MRTKVSLLSIFLSVGLALKGHAEQSKAVVELTPKRVYDGRQLIELLRQVAKDIAQCETDKCDGLKALQEKQELLRGMLSLREQLDVTREEDRLLRQQLKTAQKSQPPASLKGCLKTELLKDLMANEGIADSGSPLFAKKAVGTGAFCWTNSRKKVEATITLCEFPLAINVTTKGGPALSPLVRQREYFFAPNACDLTGVHIVDEDQASRRETFLSYSTCLETWNKRTADASMSADQVRLMEDTIGFCFRHRLLPPRDARAGRDDPQVGGSPTPEILSIEASKTRMPQKAEVTRAPSSVETPRVKTKARSRQRRMPRK